MYDKSSNSALLLKVVFTMKLKIKTNGSTNMNVFCSEA